MARLVLIDRDGVINVEKEQGYVESPQELDIYPQAMEAFALFRKHGFTCVVVTNQSVVGRGYISAEQLDAIHQHLQQQVALHGGEITLVLACTDHPSQATDRRKPGPGTLLEALRFFNARAEETPMIGDAITDMQAALAAGCKRYLVQTGKGVKTAGELTPDIEPVIICRDILEAARHITGAQYL